MALMKRILLAGAACLLSARLAAAEEMPQVSPTLSGVKYGGHSDELMNFWKAESDKPLGVLLHIHGGGWMGGQIKSEVSPPDMEAGYHHAAITYPLVNKGARQPEMLHAALRAVQFLRFKAKEWNIDPDRIVLTGGSAGGCSGLLVALHDDVANPRSADPVEHYSSRVSGAAVAGAQSTMDPFVIKVRIGEEAFGNPMPYQPFGAETVEELMENWDRYKALSMECSPVTHLSGDDPPLHLSYNEKREFPSSSAKNGIHSPIFGEIMQEACAKIGVVCHLQYQEPDRPKPSVTRSEFIDSLLLK